MSIRNSSLFLLVVLVLAGLSAFGQAAKSPYSSFGLGETYGSGLVHNKGMGDVGISNPQYLFINNMNPALLVYNRFVSFEAGVLMEQRTQKSDTITNKSGNGNINYIALSLPIIPGFYTTKWTSSISLMPYTWLNYQYTHTDVIAGSTNTVNITETGSGGINQFVWSNGVSINRWFSAGLKIAYLFSATSNDYQSVLAQTTQASPTYQIVDDRTFVSDFQFTPGIALHYDSLFKSKKYRFNFGLVYDFKSNLNATFNERLETYDAAGLKDSVSVIINKPGRITVPSSIAVGLSLSNGYKWTAALDGYYTDYTQYRDMNSKNPYAQAAWKINAGFEYSPDQVQLSNYLKRLVYRTGVSLENQAYLANGNSVKDFGITFGISLPVSQVSYLDMALKVGKKGDKALNTIEENYIKFYFGVTLSDRWFIKRKFD